jgi:hypothetical protein
MKARCLYKVVRRADKRRLGRLSQQFSREWAGSHRGRLRVVRMIERRHRELGEMEGR